MKNKWHRLESLIFGQAVIPGVVPNAGLLLLRIYAGYTILIAGLEKLPVPGWMTAQVATLGLPKPEVFAWLASFGEYAMGTLLLLGFLTRFSAGILTLIMGVAAFGFHRIIPFGEMHLTQHYFWIFLLFSVVGAGRYSFDHSIGKSTMTLAQKLGFTAVPALLVLLALGWYVQSGSPAKSPAEPAADPTPTSVSVAGTMNNWNPEAGVMETTDSIRFFRDFSTDRTMRMDFLFILDQNPALNLGDEDQSPSLFPVSGTVEPATDSLIHPIAVLLPKPGHYRIRLNLEDYTYALDSLSSITKTEHK